MLPKFVPLLVFSALVTTAGAQSVREVLLKFDEGCGDRTQVFGSSSIPIVDSLGTSRWAPGKFGTALRGSDGVNIGDRYVRTGVSWTSDFTLALWLRERHTLGPGTGRRIMTGYIDMNLSRASGSSPGRLEYVCGHPGGGFNYVRLDQDVWALTAAAWTHVALVYDDANLTATIYLDGQPQAPISVTAPLRRKPASSGVFLGPPRYPAFHDIDEFYMANRALSAAEVLTLATQPRAGVSNMPSGCSAMSLTTMTNDPPLVGSTTFGLRVWGPAGSALAIGFGTSACSLNGLSLPYDLGGLYSGLSGCAVVASQNLGTFPATLGSNGRVDVPLAIPGNALPMVLYAQAFGIDPATVQPGGSNGIAIAVGY